jgi:hypothetical protein
MNKSKEHEMKHYEIAALVLAGALGAATVAVASQPPDVVNSDSVGNTAMGGAALLNLTTGENNTAVGQEALVSNTTGSTNTAVGLNALFSNTTATANSAVGFAALFRNTTGTWNSAFGQGALYSNTVGSYNTATGVNALFENTTGEYNTADGVQALYSTTNGQYNTASGYQALYANTTGGGNTAVGATALLSNTTAYNNSAFGSAALHGNTTGAQNAGLGAYSLHKNTVGSNNVAVGYSAMYNNTSGANNVAIGLNAGYNLTSGSNNIDISNEGSAGDSGTIKIGAASTQTKTFIAGIENSKITGAAVYVTSSGQLGVLASSERYKTDIAPMGVKSKNLERLRPVTFHLKSDPHGALQYGLIAEEVDKVYPELVIRDEAGQIQGVRYDELTPMLLNEMQRQKTQLKAIQQRIVDLTRDVQTAMRQNSGATPQVAMR